MGLPKLQRTGKGRLRAIFNIAKARRAAPYSQYD